MTPNQPINENPIAPARRGGLAAAKVSSAICLLAGTWLFISPWLYGAYTSGNAWNCWIVGGLIILFAIVRLARPAYSTACSWCNMVLGIWTFFSPWIYAYAGTNQARFMNSMCVGVIVFVFSIASASAAWRRNALPANRFSGPASTPSR